MSNSFPTVFLLNSPRPRSSASHHSTSYQTTHSGPSPRLLSPLTFPLPPNYPRSSRSNPSPSHSARSTQSSRLYPSPPSSPTPATAPPTTNSNHNQATVAANPKPLGPCATDPYSIPACTSTVYNGHRWNTKGSNGFVRKYTCVGCEIIVKEKKVEKEGGSVWQSMGLVT